MAQDKIFVGRKAELEQFKKVLENPKDAAGMNVAMRNVVFVKNAMSITKVD